MDDSDLFIKGEPFAYNTQASFRIEFESCWEAERRRLGHASASHKRRRLGKAIGRRLQNDEDDDEFFDDEGDEGDEDQEFDDASDDFEDEGEGDDFEGEDDEYGDEDVEPREDGIVCKY